MMSWGELWALAWRGLTRRPVRTLLTALGITVAVASMVVFLSLGEGIRKVFTSELGGSLTMGTPDGESGTEAVLDLPGAGLPRR